MLKGDGRRLGGYSLKVPRNWATTAGPRHDDARPVRHEPVVIGVRSDVRAFVGVRPQTVDFRDTQLGERFGPNSQGSCRPLLLSWLQRPKRGQPSRAAAASPTVLKPALYLPYAVRK